MTWIVAASMGLRAVGALVGSGAEQSAQREAAAAHDYNAKIAEQNAQTSWNLASAQEALQRQRARGVLGEQAAQIAESGVTYSGSALAVAKQSAANAELDSLMIQYQGDLKARGYQAQATSEQYAGDVSRANARAARTAGWLNAGGSVLSGYANSLNVQPTTLPGASLGYQTDAYALSGYGT
jgi:hypothetical protein